MERSPEIRTLIFGIYDVLVGKPGPHDFVLDDPQVHGIGSDPSEWWDGPRLGEILTEQGAALAGAEILGADPQAFAEHGVGWAYDRFVYRTPDGVETPFRVTAAFVRRGNAWKLVLWHDAVPIANEDAIGVTIPT
ncbi:MAG: nuclear transport factor 2 family protein [Chloroflexota bacterium]